MTAKNNNRIRPAILQADFETLAAVQAINGYAPTNAAYSAKQVADQIAAAHAAQERERAAQAALDSARDDAAAAEINFHDFTLAVKDQVMAQFGKNSNEVQSLGLKKKAEYKVPVRNAKAKAA